MTAREKALEEVVRRINSLFGMTIPDEVAADDLADEARYDAIDDMAEALGIDSLVPFR